MKTRHLALPLFFLLTAAVSGCKKEDSGVDNATQKQEFAGASTQADAEAEGIYDDAFNNAMGVSAEVGIGGTGIFGRAIQSIGNTQQRTDTTSCFTVTTTQISSTARFPLKVIIDFGTGCTGRDGHTRRGKILIEYSGRLLSPGSTATTRFDGYYFDSIKVEGIHKITNKSTNDKHIYQINVTGAKLTRPNGDYTEWNSEKVITQTEGSATPAIALDDVFSISGHANGSVKKGDKYFQWATIITEPLIKKFSCRWFVKGTVAFKRGNDTVATLDYGSGSCDHTATFTVNGAVYEITLR